MKPLWEDQAVDTSLREASEQAYAEALKELAWVRGHISNAGHSLIEYNFEEALFEVGEAEKWLSHVVEKLEALSGKRKEDVR